MITTVEAYEQAFKKHYPEKDVKVRYSRRHDVYHVLINGEDGRPLTYEELQEATRMFNR